MNSGVAKIYKIFTCLRLLCASILRVHVLVLIQYIEGAAGEADAEEEGAEEEDDDENDRRATRSAEVEVLIDIHILDFHLCNYVRITHLSQSTIVSNTQYCTSINKIFSSVKYCVLIRVHTQNLGSYRRG